MAMAMACWINTQAVATKPKPQTQACSSLSPSEKCAKLFASQLSSTSSISSLSICSNQILIRLQKAPSFAIYPKQQVMAFAGKQRPVKIMISGAPASGKGTQCELITNKYGLVHIAAGDLLRTEVAADTENGKRAKEYMEKGQLVPDDIVVTMVKDRLLQPDAEQNGWLLDGYPRSLSQATALKRFGFSPDLFILLEVSEELLVERVVGRRLDPLTGRIYHLKYSPPETEEIAARLTQRFDDTEEKVKLRLRTHHQNVKAVLSMYEDITVKVNGNLPKEDVFAQIDSALNSLLEQKSVASESIAA